MGNCSSLSSASIVLSASAVTCSVLTSPNIDVASLPMRSADKAKFCTPELLGSCWICSRSSLLIESITLIARASVNRPVRPSSMIATLATVWRTRGMSSFKAALGTPLVAGSVASPLSSRFNTSVTVCRPWLKPSKAPKFPSKPCCASLAKRCDNINSLDDSAIYRVPFVASLLSKIAATTATAIEPTKNAPMICICLPTDSPAFEDEEIFGFTG